MPRYRAVRTQDSDYGSMSVDDIIVSPDKKQVKIIKAYTHEVISEPLDHFRKIEYTGDDGSAREFSPEYAGDRTQPIGWKKYKDLKDLDPEKP